MEAPRSVAARSQHRHARGADRAQSDDRAIGHLKLALDHGVKPAEISEIITHLAFYSGWANAMAAVAVTKDVFAERKIGPDELPAASPALLPLNEAAEADRAKRVGDSSAQFFPASSNTQPTSCSGICGCVPISRRATGAWSPSAL